MVKKQSISCKWNFIINIFLTQATYMRNVRNERYAYESFSYMFHLFTRCFSTALTVQHSLEVSSVEYFSFIC